MLCCLAASACVAPPPLAPDTAQIHLRAGLDALGADRPAAALRELHEAWRLVGDRPEIHEALARAYTGRGREALARWHLRAALRADPTRNRTRLELARRERAVGNFHTAAEEARRVSAEADFAEPWQALTELGWALLQAGEDDAARQSFRQATSAPVDHAPAWLGLGLLEELCLRPSAALAAYSRALEAAPRPAEAAEARVRRARVFEQLRLPELAWRDLERAARLAPESDWSEQARQLLTLRGGDPSLRSDTPQSSPAAADPGDRSRG